MRHLTLALAIACCAAPTVTDAQVSDTTSRGRLRGTIYDSTVMRPLAGATVQAALRSDMTREPYTATSDSAGRFDLRAVVAGEYVVTFFHPRLDLLGLSGPLRAVRVDAGATGSPVNLAIPATPRLVSGICGAGARDSSSAIIGLVRGAKDGRPLPGASVTVRWLELVLQDNRLHTMTREVAATADADGRFVACGVPWDVELETQAVLGAARTGKVSVTVEPRMLGTQEFALDVADTSLAPASAGRRGGANVRGIISTPEGRPLSGARVEVAGTTAASLTDASGVYSLAELPSGTQTLEVRAIGYVPIRRTVTLQAGVLVNADIRFDSSAVTLPTVDIVAEGRYDRQVAAFEHARRGGRGTFMDQATIRRRGGSRASDVLGTVPGVLLRSSNQTGGSSVFLRTSGRTTCRPTIFVDGVQYDGALVDVDMMIQPTDIVGVAVYRGRMGTPPEYVGVSACGSIVIWTRLGALQDEQAAADSTRRPPE